MKTTRLGLPAITMILAALAQPTLSHATSIVAPGWDLLQTDSGLTTFFGEYFEGVPLGSFDFVDPTIGVQNVGSTDTIIRRVGAATVPGPGNSATVVTVVDAFQLRSVGSVSILGGPLGIYYVTLQSLRGGPESLGRTTINFGPEGDPHGTFSSSFDLYLDIRSGSLSGPIVDSRQITLLDSGSVPWRHDPTGPIQIQGVNINLNGANSENDFWLEGTVSRLTPNGSIAQYNAGVPAPDGGSTFLLLGLAVVGIGWVKREQGRRVLRD